MMHRIEQHSLETLPADLLVYLCKLLAPQDIEALFLACKPIHKIIKNHDETIWKPKAGLHFRITNKNEKETWHRTFVKHYRNCYSSLDVRSKWLLTWLKEGDISALKKRSVVTAANSGFMSWLPFASKVRRYEILPLCYSDLCLHNRWEQGSMLFDGVCKQKNQTLNDYTYSLIVDSNKKINIYHDPINLNESMMIHFACGLNQSAEVIEALLQNGSAVDAVNTENLTPLYLAAYYGHLSVVKVLLAHHADEKLARYEGECPLYAAAQNGHVAVVQTLLTNGADVNQACVDGATPLYIAAQEGHVEIIKVLLANKANVLATCGGDKPLQAALENQHYEIALMLYTHELEQLADDFRKRHLNFFNETTKLGKCVGVKKAAVRALVKVVAGEEDSSTLTPHLAVLEKGILSEIYKGLGFNVSVNKHVLYNFC